MVCSQQVLKYRVWVLNLKIWAQILALILAGSVDVVV